MATVRNLAVLAYAQGFTQWHYKHTGGLIEEVLQDGFFNSDFADLFQHNDIVLISASDACAMRSVYIHARDVFLRKMV
jgi:hypothetical protein